MYPLLRVPGIVRQLCSIRMDLLPNNPWGSLLLRTDNSRTSPLESRVYRDKRPIPMTPLLRVPGIARQLCSIRMAVLPSDSRGALFLRNDNSRTSPLESRVYRDKKRSPMYPFHRVPWIARQLCSTRMGVLPSISRGALLIRNNS